MIIINPLSSHQIYLLAPKSALGNFIKKPFIKFICHTASYLTFLFLLLLASQHIARTNLHMQGPPPTVVEWMILPWVLGMRTALTFANTSGWILFNLGGDGEVSKVETITFGCGQKE